MNDKLIVNEIFYSLDGEGSRAGYPAVFVRLAGCNLRCNYCDTGYALRNNAGVQMDIAEIMDKVLQYECNNITLTGGEPLLNRKAFELVRAMKKAGMDVIIETNGSVDISEAMHNASICMDWKLPSSNMCGHMKESNLSKLRPHDVLKMVARSADLPYIKDFLDNHTINCPVYISPVFGEITLSEIADFVKGYKGHNTVRMQVQLHKIIWKPDERGV